MVDQIIWSVTVVKIGAISKTKYKSGEGWRPKKGEVDRKKTGSRGILVCQEEEEERLSSLI